MKRVLLLLAVSLGLLSSGWLLPRERVTEDLQLPKPRKPVPKPSGDFDHCYTGEASL